MKYICPACGALNEGTALACGACGFVLTADALRRKQQIERQLSGELSGEPIPPPAVPLSDSSKTPGGITETTAPEEPAVKKTFCCVHGFYDRRVVIGAAVLLLLALLSAAFFAGAFWGGRWRSAGPERVAARLEKAVNTQDWELFLSLGNSKKIAAQAKKPSWVTEKKIRTDLRVTDVFAGENGEMAVVYLRYYLDDPQKEILDSSVEREEFWPQDQITLVKEDGTWKIQYSFLYFQLMYDSLENSF